MSVTIEEMKVVGQLSLSTYKINDRYVMIESKLDNGDFRTELIDCQAVYSLRLQHQLPKNFKKSVTASIRDTTTFVFERFSSLITLISFMLLTISSIIVPVFLLQDYNNGTIAYLVFNLSVSLLLYLNSERHNTVSTVGRILNLSSFLIQLTLLGLIVTRYSVLVDPTPEVYQDVFVQTFSYSSTSSVSTSSSSSVGHSQSATASSSLTASATISASASASGLPISYNNTISTNLTNHDYMCVPKSNNHNSASNSSSSSTITMIKCSQADTAFIWVVYLVFIICTVIRFATLYRHNFDNQVADLSMTKQTMLVTKEVNQLIIELKRHEKSYMAGITYNVIMLVFEARNRDQLTAVFSALTEMISDQKVELLMFNRLHVTNPAHIVVEQDETIQSEVGDSSKTN
jgi:hypothetical protein